jgi:hypothetical protein
MQTTKNGGTFVRNAEESQRKRSIRFRARIQIASLAVGTTLSLLCGMSAWAANPLDLLEWKTRPTVSDLLAVINPLEAPNPFKLRQADALVDAVVTEGTKIIADLEHAFPGHRWAPLGRDTSVASDILESYSIIYDLKGQVVRVHASGQSFSRPEQYLGLLQTAGLLDSKGAPVVPFVLLDPTCWNVGGQIRSLTESVYQANPGLNPYVMNAVALGGSGSGTERLIPISTVVPDLNRYKNGNGAPTHVLATSGHFSYLGNDAQNVEMAWHEKFGALTYFPDRGWVAEPGKAMSRETRSHILWRMFETYKKVASPEFLLNLHQRAAAYGRPLHQLAPPFSLEAPQEAQALASWIMDWRKYSSTPRYTIFQSKIEREISHHVLKVADLGLSGVELAEFLAILSEKDRMALTENVLRRSQSVSESFEILNTSNSSQRAEFAKSHLPRFIFLRPSVSQANQFIEYLGKESDAHVSFVAQLLPLMGAKDSNLASSDYSHLIRPKMNRSAEYKAARKQYLAQQPGLMSRIRAWGSKPRPIQSIASTEVKK